MMSALPLKADMAGYSITSSAVASNDGGMVNPIAFAVLRKAGIEQPNFERLLCVGCWRPQSR
jgi:hypothetical protein